MNDAKKNIEPTIELPKYLYHYTSQKGLLGILQSNKLWMTNILYLNDSSEFTYTLNLVESELENRIDKLSKKEPVRISISTLEKWEKEDIDEKKFQVYNNLQSHYDDSTYSGQFTDIYVFSLSQEKDDLGQWRGYCPKGVGFCIEFDSEKISSIIKNTNYSLTKCVYDKEEKENIVKLLFDDLESLFESSSKSESTFSSFRTQVDDISDKDIIDILHHVRILQISSYIKHESFKNENEYRIVQIVQNVIQNTKSNETSYRHGNSMIIPYIEVSLLDNGKLPISKIIVGPTPHPELSRLSVESLLKSEKYGGVKVEISKIPYRSW
jgi:hypothetical protein